MAQKKQSQAKDVTKKAPKKAKTYKGKSLKAGGGGRFAQLTDQLKKQGKSSEQAKAIAGIAGRKKYGAKKMAGWSKKGRARRATKKR